MASGGGVSAGVPRSLTLASLHGLPSSNKGNFARMGSKLRKPPATKIYTPTHNTAAPPHQVIKPEKQTILLRFLHNDGMRNEASSVEASGASSDKKRRGSPVGSTPAAKKAAKPDE